MKDAQDDTALIKRALAGEQAAQSELVARHRDAVYRLARTATGDAEEAFDLTQEAFLAGFIALHRYDPARPFRAWIAAITLNKCRDWARRRAVRRFLRLALPDNADSLFSDEAPLPDIQVADRAELAATMRGIAALPPSLKDVLLLRTIEGLSQQDTADALGISAKAVETRLYRARQKLAESVREDAAPRV